MNFLSLWNWNGRVRRSTYALVGIIAFAIKNNLDRYIAAFGFHRPWTFFSYWAPLRQFVPLSQLSRQDTDFLSVIVLCALPFIWLGLAMTAKRLRSAGLPLAWLILFFVPFLNLAFFSLLCVLPERPHEPAAIAWRGESAFHRMLPRSKVGSALATFVVLLPIGIAFTYFGENILREYGWGLFVALPFAMGLCSVLLYGAREPRSFASCMTVAVMTVSFLGVALLGVAIEGVICLIMAAPLALALGALGGWVGFSIQSAEWLRRGAPAAMCIVLLFVPASEWLGTAMAPEPPVYCVRSSVVINAPPEEVWKDVVAFTQIPPPKEWLFRAGIAYPIRAEIQGTGPGAVRKCVFSTGPFVEPIELWDAPHLLRFSVRANPAPMEEWTPYHHIDTPHLHGYLESEAGQFRLTSLAGGRTQLEGTTWYRHSLWPASYWRLWSDAIIHRIHLRVLNHIRMEAETAHAAPLAR